MSSTLSSLLVSANYGFIAQWVTAGSTWPRRQGGPADRGSHADQLPSQARSHHRRGSGLGAGKNVITRAVGHQDYVEVDTLDLKAERGDRFLLCSDGLHGYLQDGELDRLLDGDRYEVANALINLANDRGGRDNTTVIVCDVEA